MTMPNSVPRFIGDSFHAVGQVTAANTNRDGTGTIATIMTAGAEGSSVELIRVIATGTTTAGMVRIYVHDGSNARLYYEFPITANVPSGTVEAYQKEFVPSKPMVLPTGYSLRASTHNAETFNIHVHGGHY